MKLIFKSPAQILLTDDKSYYPPNSRFRHAADACGVRPLRGGRQIGNEGLEPG